MSRRIYLVPACFMCVQISDVRRFVASEMQIVIRNSETVA